MLSQSYYLSPLLEKASLSQEEKRAVGRYYVARCKAVLKTHEDTILTEDLNSLIEMVDAMVVAGHDPVIQSIVGKPGTTSIVQRFRGNIGALCGAISYALWLANRKEKIDTRGARLQVQRDFLCALEDCTEGWSNEDGPNDNEGFFGEV